MIEEIKKRKIIRKIKSKETNGLINESLIKNEQKIDNIRKKLGIEIDLNNVFKCNFLNCEDKDCHHYEPHYKIKACDVECGVHKEVKCVEK